MVTQVYRAEDGTIFNSFIEAEQHDKEVSCRARLETLFGDDVQVDDYGNQAIDAEEFGNFVIKHWPTILDIMNPEDPIKVGFTQESPTPRHID